MEITIAHETTVFLTSLLVGAALGAVYDVFRILRIAVKTGRAAVAAEDLFYFLLCTFVTFTFILQDNHGAVRVYILFGEALGWVLYYVTVGNLVISCSKTLIRIVKSIARFFFRCFIRPCYRLLRGLFQFFSTPFRYLWRHVKKVGRNGKYGLKQTRIMLYNLLNRKA